MQTADNDNDDDDDEIILVFFSIPSRIRRFFFFFISSFCYSFSSRCHCVCSSCLDRVSVLSEKNDNNSKRKKGKSAGKQTSTLSKATKKCEKKKQKSFHFVTDKRVAVIYLFTWYILTRLEHTAMVHVCVYVWRCITSGCLQNASKKSNWAHWKKKKHKQKSTQTAERLDSQIVCTQYSSAERCPHRSTFACNQFNDDESKGGKKTKK